MRPPQNAGESPTPATSRPATVMRFNEAPAERGGKSRLVDDPEASVPASMRPPQNAGESAAAVALVDRLRDGFNEAPAERGGKSMFRS